MTMAYEDNRSYTESDTDYEKTTPELTTEQLLVRIKEWWRIDYPPAKKWHTEARVDFDFRAGEQWPAEDKKYMEDAQKRACLCFNVCDPVIDVVSGSEITNRQEVRYIPRQLGAAPVNEVLTEAARWFRDQCDAEHEESNAFADAATCGMGWTEHRLDYQEDPNGNPKISRIDPLEMVWDASAKQANLIDARRIFRVQRKVPLNEAKDKWPTAANHKPILDDADYDATWAGELADEERPYEVHYPGEPLKHETDDSAQERIVTIVQVQWYETQHFFRGMLGGQMRELTAAQHILLTNRAAMLGMDYRGIQQTRKVYYQAFIGGEILEITKMVGPSGAMTQTFTLNCITGKWDRNNRMFYGLVKAMRGPQMWANKWLSTAVEIMARNAKGGLMMEEGAVVDQQEFEEDWAKPGGNSYFKPGALTGGKVTPKPAANFPADFMGMTNFAIQAIPRVTGINVEMMGMSGSNPTSANDPRTASQEYQRRQSATIILSGLFDSLRRYRRITGRLLLYLITEFLTDGRLIRIVGQENDRYVPLIRDPNVVEYDVIVDDAPSAPSQKELVWNSMIQMLPMLQGINPPPQVMLTLLDYSPLPASLVAKIKAAVQQAQATAQPPPDPMQLIMQEKQIEVQGDAQKKQADIQYRRDSHALDIAHQREKSRIDVQSDLAREQIKADGRIHEHTLAARQREHEHRLATEQREAERQKDAQERHEKVVSPVVAEVSKNFSPIADGMMKAMTDLVSSHAKATNTLLAEIRKPRKRTLVRGADGRATHAIEEIEGG